MAHHCVNGPIDMRKVRIEDVTERNMGGYFRRYVCWCPGCGTSIEFQNPRKNCGSNGRHADVNLRRMNAAFSVGINAQKTVMYDALSGIKSFHKNSIFKSQKNILTPALRMYAEKKFEEQQ